MYPAKSMTWERWKPSSRIFATISCSKLGVWCMVNVNKTITKQMTENDLRIFRMMYALLSLYSSCYLFRILFCRKRGRIAKIVKEW
jgi:hypothetical protein